MPSDHDTLLALNADYIRSDQFADVDRYREFLAEDFIATLPDLVVRDREAFLAMLTDQPRPFTDLTAHDVRVRILGDVALIHGRVTFRTRSGVERINRYTDTYEKRGGEWKCISADVVTDDLAADLR